MNNTPALGGNIRTPDQRDFPLGCLTPESTIPAVFIQDFSLIPVEHQHQIPACGSHSGAFLKDTQEKLRLSPEYLWKRIKQIDSFPPESGTDMLSVLKTLQKVGVCEFSLMGNDSLNTLANYTDPSTITTAMDDNAFIHRSGVYAFTLNPTSQQLKEAIYNHGAVLALLTVGEEFWKPSWAEKDILPLRPTVKPVGHHFVVLHSYDEKYFYGRNSWGDTWGRKGDFYFGDNFVSSVIEIGTIVDIPSQTFTRDLWYGMANLDVLLLQKYLVKNGFGNYVPTGFFGEKTLASVKLFQMRYGIIQTGYFGPLTRAKLNLIFDK